MLLDIFLVLWYNKPVHLQKGSHNMSECNHDCSNCSSKCSEKKSLIEQTNELSCVKKVIAVVSGKGGVGKSLVTSMLSVSMRRRGYNTAILDADVTGPSIPKAFGIKEKAQSDGQYIYPVKTKTGIELMSINLLLPDESDPVVWRGPIIAGTVKQFYTDVVWDDVDFMFVDMPPGTGDVPLTVFQSLPLDGIVIVTSPQELVSMIVEKAVKMAKLMNVPIVGLVENMSYLKCPDCNKEIKLYGESHIEEIAKKHNLKVLGKLPINPDLAKNCDQGTIELFEGDWLESACDELEK
jgi:Mrp family chromosome partitioning ATPase